MKMKNLEKCILAAIEKRSKYIGIRVEMADFEKSEIIINPTENFTKKLEYYRLAYNDDLKLKNAPDKIKIIGFTYADSYDLIQQDLA